MDLTAFDNTFRTGGIRYICGTDEAGRGPLAGPVVAAAVVFDGSEHIPGVNDSKKLKSSSRELLFTRITELAQAWSYSVQDAGTIDEINILRASLLAMQTAVSTLAVQPEIILIDGNKSFTSLIPAKTIVKGDATSFAIAAASIIAKVVRDRIMMQLHEEFPQYGWDKNKAYPTPEHIKAVLTHGPCKYHRKSFLKNIDTWRQESLFGL